MSRAAVLALADLTEAEWHAQVVELAGTLGYLRYHTYRSKRSPAGFPDEVLVRDRVIYLELKREKGKLSPEQRRWVTALLDAGAEIYVVRPSDLDDLALVLAHRGDPWVSGRGRVVEAAAVLRQRARVESAA